MKSIGLGRLAGVFLAAAITLGPLAAAAPAFAQIAPATNEATAPAADSPAAMAAPAAPADAKAAIKAPEKTINKGDTAWMLISSALVLVMTVPGLALFYGGLVRQKNMLAMLMKVSVVTIIGMLAWAFWGYSLAFTDGGAHDQVFGGFSRLFMAGLDGQKGMDMTSAVSATFSTGVYIPEIVYFCFQMTFAAITAALVVGSLAERVKFSAICVFAVLWPLIVYYPMAHMVWWWPGPDATATGATGGGFIFQHGGIDFAGGSVVHINAGIAALIGCLVLGKRKGYGTEAMPPHSLVMSLIGTGLLWFGWFGFNAGSNLEANSYAGLAMANTFLATAAAAFSWMITEWLVRGKPTMLGLASGAVAGLVAVTPASGFAGPMGAIVLGLVVSPICVFFCSYVKNLFKYDDSLDVFGVHGVGGMVGAIGTGIAVNPALGGAGIVDYANCVKDGAVLGTCPTAPYSLS
ncbi:MAG TPA: ammonium transporter, partial [Caulobacteraceae bacterium]|nr:ammonium transporter [Caulobacteraceae bacterium]